MFSLLFLSVFLYVSRGQYTTEANAFCQLYDSTCGFGNANITGGYTDQADCLDRNDNHTYNVLSCNFYHLGVAYSFSAMNQIMNSQVHCTHAAGGTAGGATPCNTTMGATVAAMTGAQFCGTTGLFGQGCLPWTNGNRTEASCTVSFDLAYQANKLCYTYNAAARLTAGGPFTSDSGNLCLWAGGHAGQSVCQVWNYTTPAPTTPAPSVAGIVATGITGNYALKNFIALNVPVALGVCYQAPSSAQPNILLGNVINCNSSSLLQHLRYSSIATATPTTEADYLACTNTTMGVKAEQIDVPYGNCAGSAVASAYALTQICVVAAVLNPTNATACSNTVCNATISPITVPVLTGACVNSGYNSLLGSVYSRMTCTDTALTYTSYATSDCSGNAIASAVASSTADCTVLASATVTGLGDIVAFMKWTSGSCVGQSTDGGSDAVVHAYTSIMAIATIAMAYFML